MHVEELSYCSNFFLSIAILIFLSVMTNYQTKCGIIYENIAIWVCDDERMINHEWPELLNWPKLA